MNRTIRVKKGIHSDDIEQLYKELFSIPSVDVDLVLPNELNNNDIGQLQSLVQFITTWTRLYPAGNLLVELEKNEQQILEFISQEFAYIAVILCWYKNILFISDRSDLKSILKPYTKRIQQSMQSLSNGRGQKLLLTCFDHIPSKNGLLNCFYESGRFISSDVILSFSLNSAISHVLSFNKSASKESIAPILDDLIAIIFELMKNTDEWGRTDVLNAPVNPSVRGLFIRFLKRNKASLQETYSKHRGMTKYFDALSTNNVGEVYFLEVSVFDSGVGFVEKYKQQKAEQFSPEEQVEIVKQCLVKNNTSALGLRKQSKGLGLDRILSTVNNKGLFWIRTGNVSLFRNLKENPHKDFQSTNEISLADWYKNSDSAFTKLDKVVGSSITILYPIKIGNE